MLLLLISVWVCFSWVGCRRVACMSDSGKELDWRTPLDRVVFFVGDMYWSTSIQGYTFRATPTCIATALRFAKRRLFQGLWHEWTADDQVHFDRGVLLQIVGDRWWSMPEWS